MMAAMVSAIFLLMLLLMALWLLSPAFRTWAERAKYSMLERNEMFERAMHPVDQNDGTRD